MTDSNDNTRVYKVVAKYTTEDKPPTVRLVRAKHPSSALAHVAHSSFEVAVASQADLIEYGIHQRINIETAGAEPAQETPAETPAADPA